MVSGRSAADAASGHQPSASAAISVASSRSGVPNAAWTPGPWDFERGADSRPRPWIGRLEDNAYSALACGETHEEAMANAALIATAPELYRYLELALGVLDRANVAWGGEPGARAILAKARAQVSA